MLHLLPILPHQRTRLLSSLRHTNQHLPPSTPIRHPHHASNKLTSKITDIARSRITVALRRHVWPPIMHSLQKNKIVSVKFIHALCSCLSTHDYMAMQAMVWPCLLQDRVIQFGAERVRLVLHTQM